MKSYFYIFLCFGLASFLQVCGQTPVFHTVLEQRAFSRIDSISDAHLLALFLASDASVDTNRFEQIHKQVNDFYFYLSQGKTQIKSQRKYIKWVSKQLQGQFLQQYQAYPAFYRVFTEKTYNCLSGTALFALFFQRLGYTIEVHETAFHAYLLVKLNNRKFLLDATDPEQGFISDLNLIRQRELLYRQNEQAKLQPAFNRTIQLIELAGLQYYNEAMLKYNRQNFAESASLLDKAGRLYPRSERISLLQSNTRQLLSDISTTATQHKKKVASTATAGLSNK